MKRRLPGFLVLGAPKSGTTSLALWLGAHPSIYMVPEKELRFFDHHYERGLDWYRECFAGAREHAVAGEATPSYLYDERVPQRLARTLPDGRFIAILRNPVDRAYSHYSHWRIQKGEPRSFEHAIDEELARPDGPCLALPWDPEQPGDFPYLGYGRYAHQLERFCAHVPRERLLVLLFDDLVARPVETFLNVCRFIGIDDGTVPDRVGIAENPYHYYSPAWLWNIFVRVRIGKVLPGRVGLRLWRSMFREGPQSYPPLDPGLHEALSQYYRADNAALSRWLGRDLPGWS